MHKFEKIKSKLLAQHTCSMTLLKVAVMCTGVGIPSISYGTPFRSAVRENSLLGPHLSRT